MTRRKNIAARLLAACVAVGALTCLATPSLAQQGGTPTITRGAGGREPLTTPVPAPPRNPPAHLLGTAMAFILGALVVGVNFIPSKRGHQD